VYSSGVPHPTPNSRVLEVINNIKLWVVSGCQVPNSAEGLLASQLRAEHSCTISRMPKSKYQNQNEQSTFWHVRSSVGVQIRGVTWYAHENFSLWSCSHWILRTGPNSELCLTTSEYIVGHFTWREFRTRQPIRQPQTSKRECVKLLSSKKLIANSKGEFRDRAKWIWLNVDQCRRTWQERTHTIVDPTSMVIHLPSAMVVRGLCLADEEVPAKVV
jgi:hypothetical protein